MRLITAITLALLIPGIALADTGEQHLERAQRAEADGEYLAAQNEYIAAYNQLKDPRLFYYLAQVYEADGRAEPAVMYYRRYLRKVEVPDAHRKEVLARIEALEPPPVAPVLRPPGAAPIWTAPPRAIDAPRGARSKEKTRWYGWQIMLSDLATLVLTAQTESGDVFLAGYLLAPVVIHAANGNGGKALGSPALRAGLPLGGGLLGLALADCDGSSDTFCGLGAATLGVATGGLVAIIIDYSWSTKTLEQPPGYVTVGQCQGPTPCTTLGYAMSW